MRRREKRILNTIGNAVRTKRNLDFYEGGAVISGSEAKGFLRFVQDALDSVSKIIYKDEK